MRIPCLGPSFQLQEARSFAFLGLTRLWRFAPVALDQIFDDCERRNDEYIHEALGRLDVGNLHRFAIFIQHPFNLVLNLGFALVLCGKRVQENV